MLVRSKVVSPPRFFLKLAIHKICNCDFSIGQISFFCKQTSSSSQDLSKYVIKTENQGIWQKQDFLIGQSVTIVNLTLRVGKLRRVRAVWSIYNLLPLRTTVWYYRSTFDFRPIRHQPLPRYQGQAMYVAQILYRHT